MCRIESRVKMKAHSLDVWQKILDTYLKGGITQLQLAEKFCVTLGFGEKLLNRNRKYRTESQNTTNATKAK